MTGAPPLAAVRVHSLKEELAELRVCLDGLISLVADAGDVDTKDPRIAALTERAKAFRLRVERLTLQMAEIYEDLDTALPHPDPVSLAEIRGDLECIANDRLEPALGALRLLLARFPEEPE